MQDSLIQAALIIYLVKKSMSETNYKSEKITLNSW